MCGTLPSPWRLRFLPISSRAVSPPIAPPPPCSCSRPRRATPTSWSFAAPSSATSPSAPPQPPLPPYGWMRPRAAPSPADRKLAALLAVLLSVPAVIRAQANATIDLGASLVRYDGFVVSSAAAVTPKFDWYGRRAALNARGTYLRFESGNRSVQGSVVGSLLTRPANDWRLEISGTAGVSSYADFASFWHLLGEARLRRESTRGSIGVAAIGGRTTFGSSEEARPVFAASAIATQRRGSLGVLLSAGRAFVGDTQYSDIGMTARGQYHKIVLEMLLGARVWSEGAGDGVYGEGSGSLPLSERWSVVVAGGRYPSDPIRGSIAGRYLSASMRFHLQSPPRPTS